MTTLGVSSTNTADVWLNWYRGTNATAPTAIWIKLHTGDPGAAGAGNAAVGDATRKQGTFAAATGTTTRAIALTATVTGWVNGGTSETITHVSVWDASSAGNFLHNAILSASQAWVSTNTFSLTSLGVSINPVAT